MGSQTRKKAADREAKRAAKQELQARRRREQRRRAFLIYGSIAAMATLLVGLLLWSALRPKPGGAVASQGQAHIAPGAPHPPYNSNPPTSGWMMDQTVPWGVHSTEFPDEVLVHNLEHGGVWISYRDPDDGEVVANLRALASGYRSKVIVTPRRANDSRIAVAAWQRILKLDAYDEKAIVAFIRAFRNRGPERTID